MGRLHRLTAFLKLSTSRCALYNENNHVTALQVQKFNGVCLKDNLLELKMKNILEQAART